VGKTFIKMMSVMGEIENVIQAFIQNSKEVLGHILFIVAPHYDTVRIGHSASRSSLKMTNNKITFALGDFDDALGDTIISTTRKMTSIATLMINVLCIVRH
jgi:hypothetical protein